MAFGLWLAGPAPAAPIPITEQLPTTIGQRIAKAEPDECFGILGLNLPFNSPPCIPFLQRPKVNHSYPWGVTLNGGGDKIIIGTAVNPHCVAQGVFGLTVPYQTDSWACEFGKGPYAFLLPGLDLIGDFRPPRILAYDKATHVVTDITPPSSDPDAPFGVPPEVLIVRGMRFAATIEDLTIVGGPTLTGDVNLFAYDTFTQDYLGFETLPGLTSIRRSRTVDGEMYIGVGKETGGEVLRWVGSKGPPPCADCFSFEKVAELDGAVAYLEYHEDRLFASTWPSGQAGSFAAIYMSRPLNGRPLTAADANSWRKVWDARDYEPDPLLAAAYAGGAMASFDGYLMFGTANLPNLGITLFFQAYGDQVDSTEEALLALAGTFRPTSLFRGRNFGSPSQEIDLLYGSGSLPVYNPLAGAWSLQSNLMGMQPLLGYAGYFNPYNHYTWTMRVWDDRLWIGTFDGSYAFQQGAEVFAQALLASDEIDPEDAQALATAVQLFYLPFTPFFGGDLYYMTDAGAPAFPESLSGVGNFTNWGVRNMLITDGDLVMGMANPSNLLGDPNDLLPEGGWELLRLRAKSPNTSAGDDVTISVDDGAEIGLCAVDRPGYTYGSLIPNFFLDYEEEIEQLFEMLFGEPPPMENGFAPPPQFLFTDTTAGWRDSCASAQRAEVCLPVAPDALNPELRQLQFNEGALEWVPLASSVSEGQLCGQVTANHLGLFASHVRNCDVDGSGAVNRKDLNAITARRNQPAGVSDPFDVDGDGRVTALDVRVCVTRCATPGCAP